MAVINHVAHHYENRSTTTQFEKVETPQSSLALIQALRGEYAKWKSANSSTE
ncbi:phage gp6-like head-tail connector protein [Staphylococcus nepalensis]|uniref:head-tail connector protein n=1 Tax=Staphylococcus nepalensis TaxID=214473 RepID=UPI00226F5930|nr:head-tail connector protein [Staphylococcus nepalensis]MCY1039647.1 phage gp6-like head-tail connector protein [Staphylococcus nepalensis]